MLNHFTGTTATPLYLPNLTLWYSWHKNQGTMPERWVGNDPTTNLHRPRCPAWDVARPYVLDPGNATIETEEADGKRVTHYRRLRYAGRPLGTWPGWRLVADGICRQKCRRFSDSARNCEERSYRLDASWVVAKQEAVGASGMVGMELPRRPFSQIFLEWLGWGDGLMLLWDAPDLIDQILSVLETKIQALVAELAEVDGPIVMSPDNLDAQFISPPFFTQYLAASYTKSAELLHEQGKILLVDTGGPINKLLKPLADCGVDGVQGVSGPPQCDATLAEARELVGPDFTLWGGIPQDALLADFPVGQFEAVVKQAAVEARENGRAIIGVADRVPTLADIERLQAIPQLLNL